ncbi:hypothetical protein B0T24DRAFT_589261 [Lasiosphaeria ovina]|uniref:Uncharacterized protein n=1 Tax=Lasiosphaeria ovina TaxID=92902 RepID=A0AAE0KM47_9PEZI|nr:hypothetical protein B0T24DRAFT_589261 [Lasiosphaeria ovina]
MSDIVEYGPVSKRGNREFRTNTHDGTQYTRRIKNDGSRTDWMLAEVSPAAADEEEEPRLALMVVLEMQSEGEPNHWSLFGSGPGGSVYQVTGDATYMTRKFDGVQHLSSESYSTSYVVAYLDEAQAGVVRQVATQEPPLWAHNRALVTENCQGWTCACCSVFKAMVLGR